MTVESKQEYSQVLELRIDWSDLDSFGHVNNLKIMEYAQSARVEYLNKLGLMQMQAEEKMGPILASAGCQFRKPLFYPGKVCVYSCMDYVKNTSFKMSHDVYNEKGELVAQAYDIIVFYDFRKNVKQPVPDDIRQKIQKMEECRFVLQ